MTFKVIQEHWQWCHSIGHIRFPVTGHYAYWSFRLRDILPTTWAVRLQIALFTDIPTYVIIICFTLQSHKNWIIWVQVINKNIKKLWSNWRILYWRHYCLFFFCICTCLLMQWSAFGYFICVVQSAIGLWPSLTAKLFLQVLIQKKTRKKPRQQHRNATNGSSKPITRFVWQTNTRYQAVASLTSNHLVTVPILDIWAALHSGRTPVSDRRTFSVPVPRSTCSYMGDHLCG